MPFQDTDAAKASFGIGQRTVISTFGLISRGKGLEYAIEAMRDVVKRHPETLYLILGETHPVVRRQEGESYRESLISMVRDFGLNYNVQLIDKYLDFDEVVSYLAATDIYLTPYLNPGADRQRNAGVRRRLRQGDRLDAVSLRAGAPRAQSRLSLRVSRRSLDREPAEHAARRSRAAARDRTPRLPLRTADDVAARRLAVRGALCRALPARTDGARQHCVRGGAERSRRWTTWPSLTDDVGIIQHALYTSPNRKTGYCTDDVSRAFIVALEHLRLSPNDRQSQRFASTYLAFLQHAQLADGRFHNFMEYDRRWLR